LASRAHARINARTILDTQSHDEILARESRNASDVQVVLKNTAKETNARSSRNVSDFRVSDDDIVGIWRAKPA
jgi:hypothetical protein